MRKQLIVLLIEDDENACIELTRCIELCDNIRLAASTNNSIEALELTKFHLPDVVILDLELHHGGGNGLHYLQKLPELSLTHIPYILVTTHNSSTTTYDFVRKHGADFILAKYEANYSAQYVVDFLLMMHDVISNKKEKNPGILSEPPSPEALERKLRQRIQREMDLIGINPKSVGYRYLIDSIAIIYHNPENHLSRILSAKYHRHQTSIERAMQNAINSAWLHTDIETLLKYYTARISNDKAVPTMMEFIYYYATKLKNEI